MALALSPVLQALAAVATLITPPADTIQTNTDSDTKRRVCQII